MARDVTSRARPSASIRLTTAGVTLSLKRSCTVFGACASTLPSAGSVATSDACANAAVARQRADKNAASAARRRAIQTLCLRHQLDARRRRLAVVVISATAFRGDLDPAADAL